MALDFIEKYDELENPYDKIFMERTELAKLEIEKVNELNKYIWEEDYNETIHVCVWDIKKDLIQNADEITLKKIDVAEKRNELRYKSNSTIKDVIPLRTFLTLKDIAQFEVMENLKILADELDK